MAAHASDWETSGRGNGALVPPGMLRLKELKQREFARNVASKSWKDERKQEKALKRLHQLAELRKQSECVTRGGPLFRTPKMAIGKQLQAGLFAENAGNGPGARFIVTCEGHTIPSNISENQQEITPGFRNQILQALPDGSKVSHRAGVSFCFSKKAQLKLESSASVFTENSEEATDGPEPLTLKLKQSSNGFRYLALLRDDTETNQNTSSVTSHDYTGNSILINVPTENTILKEAEGNFGKSLKIPDDHPTPDPICNVKCSDENRENSTNKLETTVDSKECEKPSETEASFHCQTNIFYTQQNKCNKHSNTLLMESSAELSSSLSVSIEPVAEAEGSANAQNTETGLKEADAVHENEDSPKDKGLANGVNPEAMSFLHVVSKDGNTVLQWPTELLLYTKSQPSISYGCNPLYFDFKLSGNSKPSKDNAKVDGTVNLEINSIIQNELFDLVGHEETPSKHETTSKEPKPKCSFNRLSQQNFETCTRDNHKNCGTSKRNPKTFYENGCVISPHINIEEKCDLEVKTFLKRKRKYVLQDKFADMDNAKLSRECDQTSLPPSGNGIKKHKKDHCAKGKSEYEIRPHHHYTSQQTQCKCPATTNSDSPEDSLSNKACSCCKHSGYDSDGCSLGGCCRLSRTHSSPSGRHSTNSDTSIYSSAGSHYCWSPGQRSSDNSHRSHPVLCCKKRKERIEESPWKHGKHRYSSTSEEEVDSMVQTKSHRVRKREEKNYLKKEKHKESEGRSRHRCSQNKHRSKRRKAKHRLSRKEPSGCYSDENSGRTQSKPISCSESSGYRRFSGTTSELFSTDQAQCLKANKETCREQDTHPHNLQTVETIASACLNEASGFKSNNERLPTIITTDSVQEENVQLEETLLLDTMQLELRSRNEHESKDSPEELTVELYNQSKDVFPVQLSPPHASSSVLPLFETVCTTSTTSLQNCEAGASGGTEKKAQFGETQEYKVTLTAHTEYEHCHFKDIIRIGGDCQSLSTEKPAAIHEQSSPLISQVKPFIHSCNPLPNDFPCALPSHRYSVVSDSMETKEEQIKLGLHDVNMDPSPLEEQLNYYYDSTMQNYGDSEHLFEVYDKSCSPSLPQQTIAFSHEEIDKYRRLEMQAQQQMHTQFVAKHLKVFPVSGPTAFSVPPVVHPVPVQQQTAITTIHHTLLQRCALSATVHSHNNNFPVAHVHPLAQAHFTPIAISHLAPAVIPAHTTFFAGHPLHLFSATAIHPGQLTLHALPHAALIPTLFSPHLGTGASSAVHLHPLIHPLFPAQEFQHSGPGQTL